MKISKKILAILLAVTLACSLFAISASAAGTPTGTEAMTVTITTDNETYEAESVVQVRVSIACNYNATAFRFPILFDSSVYEVPTIIGLVGYNTCASSGTINSNVIDISEYTTAYDSSAFGCVLVQWSASVANGEVGHINNEEGELVFTFELKTKSSAVGKTGTILIPEESELDLEDLHYYYQAIENPADANTFYYLDSTTCAMTFVPANAMVVGEQVALVSNEDYGTPAVIDEENRYVYGFNLGIGSNADIKEYVKATGDAVIRSTPNDIGYGTGTAINLQIDAVTVKSYTLIIFGDLDGDANADVSDLNLCSLYASAAAVCEEPHLIFAGDLTGDDVVDVSDLPIFQLVASAATVIDQTNPY